MSDKLELIRGDDQVITLTFVDENDDPVNLTGSTVFFTAKKNRTDADTSAIIKIEQATHISPLEGKTEITITNAISEALAIGDYFWDAQIKFPTGLIRSINSDILTVVPDITRRVVVG